MLIAPQVNFPKSVLYLFGFLSSAFIAASGALAAVTISTATTQNMSCSGGVCSPTAADAVLNVTDLTTMLASGNVTVNTGSGSLAQQVEDIIVAGSFNWASANSLTLDAYRSVTVDQAVAVNGAGAVALTTNDGGSGGALSFQSGGSISFLGTSNTLAINGSTYTLENSIAALAAAITSNPAGSYALAGNYNASQDGTYPQSPITATLTGTVEGLGNTISNLFITAASGQQNIGMFENVGTTGAIENMLLNNIGYTTAHSEPEGVGGLAASNAGLLFNDSAQGTITAERASGGGLVGSNTGTVSFSSASVTVKADYAGGLVQENYGTVSLSHAEGLADGKDVGGGLVATNYGLVSQCFATGHVKGEKATVGGLAGFNDGSGSLGQIENSYATGAVSAEFRSAVGGLIGANSTAAVSASYSTGRVSGGSESNVGGFAGLDDGYSIADSYWDTTTSGTTDGVGGGNVSGLTGETTHKLKAGLPAGFDPTIWAESPSINNGLPYLIANPPQ
jgi:GLUG motif-containing protein